MIDDYMYQGRSNAQSIDIDRNAIEIQLHRIQKALYRPNINRLSTRTVGLCTWRLLAFKRAEPQVTYINYLYLCASRRHVLRRNTMQPWNYI
jgi:hypothetical protein